MPPAATVIVDSGSENREYLQPYVDQAGFTVLQQENIGFSQANNLGWQVVQQQVDFVLFLNPDAFPAPDSLELALAFLKKNQHTGCVGGKLLGFDSKSKQPTGLLDSTGVFRKWFGRWYDRDHGQLDCGQHSQREEVPALCGAFLFCRKTALESVALAEEAVFDPDFFLYKEDIELCLRLKKKGWQLVYLSEILVHHCRGWQMDRQQISYTLRLTAAHSELLLYRKHPSPYMLWALAKYFLVRGLRI